MSLKRFVQILKKNERITVINEFGVQLFKGPVWWLNDKFILSCLVIDVYRKDYTITIVVAD